MSRIRDYSHTLETARIVLEQMTGSTVKFGTVVGIESLEHIVLRVPIIQGEGLPEKVIIKQISEHTEHGHPEHAMNEWAGLEFLNNVAHTKQFAPRLLGGDGDSRLLILEDMGDVSTLSHILQGAERTIIEQTLVEYGTFLGEFHGTTYGREAEFKQIQTRLVTKAPTSDSSLDLRGLLNQFRETFAPITDRLEEMEKEIVAASVALHDNPLFRTFQHHDTWPGNILVTPKGFRLIDYEFAQYNNALLDMKAPRLAFAPLEQGLALSKETILAYESAYREALSPFIPEIMDEALYELTLEQACVKWLVTKTIPGGSLFYPVIVCNKLDKLPDPNMIQAIPDGRNQGYAWCLAYLQWFVDKSQLPYSRDAYQRITDEIKQRNPDVDPSGMYGAFAV